MTFRQWVQGQIKRIDRTKPSIRQGEVVGTSPLEVTIGASDVSVFATASDGVELQVGDRVSVAVQGRDLLVLGRNTDDPQDAGGGGTTYGAGDGPFRLDFLYRLEGVWWFED